MKKNFILAIFLVTFSINTILGKDFFIKDRLDYKNFFIQIYPYIYGEESKNIFNKYKNKLNKGNEQSTPLDRKIEQSYKVLSSYYPENALRAIITYRYLKPNKEILNQVMTYFSLNKLMVIRDSLDFSTQNRKEKEVYLDLIRKMSGLIHFDPSKIYQTFYPLFKEKIQNIIDMEDEGNFLTAIKETNIITFPLSHELSSPYSLSHLGLISGNKIEILQRNTFLPQNPSQENFISSLLSKNEIDFKPPYINRMMRNEETPPPHLGRNPILKKIKEMIIESKESIFFNIPLQKGQIASRLIHFLLDQCKEKVRENSNFKVILFKQKDKEQGHLSFSEERDESSPLLRNIRKKIASEEELKKSFIILESQVPLSKSHSLSSINLQENKNKIINHSNIIIVDGNSRKPRAYLGAKNGENYESSNLDGMALYIEGPGAALIQDSYRRDIEFALKNNSSSLPKEDIIKSFKVTRESIPYAGEDILRIAQNDGEGIIKNIRNILVDMIIQAKDNIYIAQNFFYDRYIIDTLLKKKIESPKIDIKILLSHNQNLGLNGLPNTIFLNEMKKKGIKLRTLKTRQEGFFSDKKNENIQNFLSIDGRTFITGSSEITPNSLNGNSREMNIQVFGQTKTKKRERAFLKVWNNPQRTAYMNIENFEMTLKGNYLNKEMSKLINAMMAFFIRNKENI